MLNIPKDVEEYLDNKDELKILIEKAEEKIKELFPYPDQRLELEKDIESDTKHEEIAFIIRTEKELEEADKILDKFKRDWWFEKTGDYRDDIFLYLDAGIEFGERIGNCSYCGQEVKFKNKDGSHICPDCQEKYRVCNVYGHNFGLIIPSDSGVLWQQQTKGVMCGKVLIEGVYIPLRRPSKWTQETGSRDLLQELRKANYNFKSVKAGKLWNEISDQLKFNFKEVSRPNPSFPRCQEGLKWIEITGTREKYSWQNTFNLEGEKVALIYPNCD